MPSKSSARAVPLTTPGQFDICIVEVHVHAITPAVFMEVEPWSSTYTYMDIHVDIYERPFKRKRHQAAG